MAQPLKFKRPLPADRCGSRSVPMPANIEEHNRLVREEMAKEECRNKYDRKPMVVSLAPVGKKSWNDGRADWVKGKSGNPAGRPVGSKNKTTQLLKHAIITAAERVGEDGTGKEGLIGYLVWMAKREPKAMAMLLGKVLPLQITDGDGNAIRPPRESTMTIQEMMAAYVQEVNAMRNATGVHGVSSTKH
jgi:hypothetical protein